MRRKRSPHIVEEPCLLRLTEYLPLAIGLAAAWAGKCSLKEIAEGIAATALGPFSEQPPRTVHIGESGRHRSLMRQQVLILNRGRKRVRTFVLRIASSVCAP